MENLLFASVVMIALGFFLLGVVVWRSAYLHGWNDHATAEALAMLDDEMEFNEGVAVQEMDVPHWAWAQVQEMRKKQSIPARVTDRMIYARMVAKK